MKLPKAAIFILGITPSLNLIPECLAESITKRDLADVLPVANLFVRKTEPFGHYLGYTTKGGYLVGAAFVTTEIVPEESWGYRDQIVTLVGVDAKGKITGVKVLSEFESPRYTTRLGARLGGARLGGVRLGEAEAVAGKDFSAMEAGF